ncbi:hypothetical protein HT136_00875 [Novosphingobium profundi]|uniref:hypothetical protein n=1 Tax=Novosphingobium profundi TaxID=1774954 RepID=UPI001BD93AF8|nr:hypothetical protein [Novosphingobium profundi]MBT0666922.1 hypothetical protein [Novosphingobium profundi]
MRPVLPLTLAICTLMAVPVQAQVPEQTPVAPTAPAEDPAVAARVEANRVQAELAQDAAQSTLASRKAHDDAVRAARTKSESDEAAYMAALSAHRKDVAKYDAEQAEWEKIVAACKQGDRKLCPPKGKTAPKRK